MFTTQCFSRKRAVCFWVCLSIFIRVNYVWAQNRAPNIDVQYIHPDHLGGTAIVTNPQQKISELIDYYPFGSMRIDQQTGVYNEKRKFIGETYDSNTGLDYLNARYYDPQSGKFISQDPEFWNLSEEYLLDPQQLNSYSYSRNNPIILKDPLGLSSAISYSMPRGGWQLGQKMGSFNGVSAYYNGIGSSSTSYSCVEYAKRYVSQTYGMNSIGPVSDAKTMWSMVDTINSRLAKNGSSYTFEKHVNGAGGLPGQGDLLFWTEGKYGHVMVVTESSFNADTGKGYVEIIDQNASKQAVRTLDIKQSGDGYVVTRNNGAPVAGWFSAKGATVASPNISASTNSPRPSSSASPLPWYQKAWNGAKQLLKNLTKR